MFADAEKREKGMMCKVEQMNLCPRLCHHVSALTVLHISELEDCHLQSPM
jgi:hypothetical protein